jgi:hypothetical protein
LEVHEAHEHIEEAHEHKNKRAALLIVLLAASLAIIEMAGKEAQFESIAENIKASDLYAFYQAKTIRSTVLRTALESAEALSADGGENRQKQLATWKGAIQKLDSDPEKREGRQELLERAKETEAVRDHAIHAYHDYEYGAASLQLAIVMASAAVITEVTALELISAGLGLVGLAFGLLGWLSPDLLKL